LADFSSIKLQGNTGASDGSPTWTDLTFGSSGYELRANLSGNGATTTTPSASWPAMLKPASGATLVDQLWLFTADTTGHQITTYDGTGSHYNQLRINWDNTGTFSSAPLISAWKDNTLTAASPGTQNTPGDGSNIVNGTSGESSSRSLIKATVYGYGLNASGVADNPSSNMGSNPTVTTGTGAGAVTTTASTWTSWQDLQSSEDWIANGVIPQAATAGTWNFLLAMYIAASMVGGVEVPVIGVSYTWI
jgi:hypothetical protein